MVVQSTRRGTSPSVSVVVPVYNEQESVRPLYKEIISVCAEVQKDFEIIFVDDGSRDHTFSIIKQIAQQDKRVKGIQFTRNFKKSMAYMAGFEHARGDIIITMDGDLQDNPSEIPKLLEGLQKYDLVVGWKFPRRDSWWKKFTSRVFNALYRFLYSTKLHDADCGFRAMKRDVMQQLTLYGDLYRFIPALVARLGFKVGEVKVLHRRRKFGTSKYGFTRFFTGAFDLLTVKVLLDFQQKPLHFFGSLGTTMFFLGILAELYVLYWRIVGHLFVQHLPMLLLGVLLMLLGVQLFGIGLVGELICSKIKYNYVVKEQV